jgi:hypothetical protein
MIIAALVALFMWLLGGDGPETLFADIEDRAGKAIADEARRGEVVELSRRLEEVLSRTRREFEESLADLHELNRNYHSARPDFAARAEAVDGILLERQRAFLTTRAEMKQRMSKEEWEALLPPD